MQIVNGIKSLGAIKEKRCVVTVGSFDGIHLGHRKLINEVVAVAKKNNQLAVVYTFDPHPSTVLRPQSSVVPIFPRTDAEAEIKKLGIDILIYEPFTLEFSRIPREKFVEDYLIKPLKVSELIIGYDFAFGADRKGSFEYLKEVSEKFNFKLKQIEPLLIDGRVVSSSLIRNLVVLGDFEKVNQLLGRPYYLEGIIETGDGRGRQLGFPTANFKTKQGLLPGLGVYITEMIINGAKSPSITNVGIRPTFQSDGEVIIENHLLFEKKDMYGITIQVLFHKRLRDELKFNSADELVEQIKKDVSLAKKYFGE